MPVRLRPERLMLAMKLRTGNPSERSTHALGINFCSRASSVLMLCCLRLRFCVQYPERSHIHVRHQLGRAVHLFRKVLL